MSGVGAPDEFICGLCQKQQSDPRVLPCFHSFCLGCLQDLRNSTFSRHPSTGSYGNVSIGSGSSSTGYESDVAADAQCLQCPTCGHLGKLPPGGATCLPPHYILQHKMLLASLNRESVAFFCDLCTTDVSAVARCSECLVNLCSCCLEIHSKQSRSVSHQVQQLLSAHSAAGKNNITAIQRQLMCTSHPDRELTLFCSDCQQVVCRSCCMLVHRGHMCEDVDRAAKVHTLRMQEKLDRTRLAQKDCKMSLETLNAMAQRIELRCAEVETDVDKFIEDCTAALQEHRRQLRCAVAEARNTKLNVLKHHKQMITRLIDRRQQSLAFGQQLLTEGAPAEILMFTSSLLSRLEASTTSPSVTSLPDLKALETINLLTEEKSPLVMNKQLYGVITTQRTSSLHSSIHPDGLVELNNTRQQQPCEVVLVTRDSEGQPMCHGGDHVAAQLNYRDLSRRCIPVSVRDNQDGTYAISFTPDSAGNMALSLAIGGVPVQGSPFSVCVRTLRPHHGSFHCCCFCSTGGKKHVTCGCGGTMPGGYKGCGHGHVGHPGRRHWSCCGNVLHNSECGRPPSTLYHLTLYPQREQTNGNSNGYANGSPNVKGVASKHDGRQLFLPFGARFASCVCCLGL